MTMQLEDYVFPEIYLKANPDFDSELASEGLNDAEMDISLTPKIAQSDPQKYLIQMNISITTDDNVNSNIPYEINIVGVIRFSFLSDEDAAKRNPKAFLNGASILYAGAREQIAQMTARNFNSVFFLPAYYFSSKDFIGSEEPKE